MVGEYVQLHQQTVGQMAAAYVHKTLAIGYAKDSSAHVLQIRGPIHKGFCIGDAIQTMTHFKVCADHRAYETRKRNKDTKHAARLKPKRSRAIEPALTSDGRHCLHPREGAVFGRPRSADSIFYAAFQHLQQFFGRWSRVTGSDAEDKRCCGAVSLRLCNWISV
jgi:hypothetical protein